MWTYKFVTAIGAAPTTRLDLHSGSSRVLSGVDFGTPSLKRAFTGSLLTDGERVSASAYGNRTLRLPIELTGYASDADRAAAWRALYRELDQERNTLMVQVGDTPVFFRTYRAPEAQLSRLAAMADTVHTVEIPAEPFAYGERQDSGDFTVPSNPATAGGCVFDVTGVLGDVETPLVLRVADAVSVSIGGPYGNPATPKLLVATRRRGTPANLSFVLQAESGTLGTDTTLPGSGSASFSGSGINYASTSFATATFATRLTLQSASTDYSETRGRYRVLVRVRRTSSSSAFTIGLGSNTPVVWAADASSLSATLDLGLLSHAEITDAMGLESLLPDRQPTVTLGASRTAGTGTLRWDYALLIPADDQMWIGHPGLGTSAFPTVLDGVQQRTYQTYRSGLASYELSDVAGESLWVGRIPSVTPGRTNRVYAIRSVGSGFDSDLTDDLSLNYSYYPRYLTVA